MIREVILNRFGKFTGTRFSLAPVTVFTGRNEAGKTTLFDALFYALCKPRATRKTGRELKERYGDAMDVKITPQPAEALFDEDEFLNLYAIRSGNIDLDLAASSSWMEKVKSHLFTGGLDPRKLRDKFDALSSTRGSFKHNREMTQLAKENTQLKSKLVQLQEKRNSCLERQNRTAKMKADLDSLQKTIEIKASEFKAVETEWESKKKAKEKALFISILGRIGQAGKRAARLKELAVYAESQVEELDKLQRQLGETGRGMDLAREKQKQFQGVSADLEQKLLEEQATFKKQQAAADQAAGYLNQINSFLSNPPLKKSTAWNKALLFSTAFPLLAGLLPLFFLTNPVLQLVFPLIGLLVAVIMVLLARKERTTTDEQKIAAYIQWLKDDWRNRGNPGLNSGSLNGLADELQDIRRKCDVIREKINTLEEEKLKNSKALIRTGQEILALSDKQEKISQDMTQWFKSRNVKNRDDYLRQAIEYSGLQKEEQAWAKEVKALMNSYHFTEAARFESYVTAKVRELEAESAAGIFPGDVPADPEINSIEADYKARQKELDNLKQEFSSLNAQAAQETGKLSESSGSLTNEIVETEKVIQENKQKMEKLNIKREAAILARNIFDTIARDSESVMLELSRELANQFGRIVPELREVELPELKTEVMRITDASGEKRLVEHLSRGTKDAFLFAARLSLARKANKGPGLLILDEPFYSLDDVRLRSSLELVKLFIGETGWQIIIFTKEEVLARIVEECFPQVLINRL